MLYPIMNRSRSLIDLGGIWHFQLGDETEPEDTWSAPAFFLYLSSCLLSAANIVYIKILCKLLSGICLIICMKKLDKKEAGRPTLLLSKDLTPGLFSFFI